MSKDTTMSTYTSNYYDYIKGEGREFRFLDESMSYCYEAVGKDTLTEAFHIFAKTYDLGDAASATIRGQEFLDGEACGDEIDFEIEA